MHIINLAAGLDITKNPMESQQSQSPQRHNEYSTTKPSMNPHSVPPSSRLRTRTATDTAGIATAFLEPLLRAEAQLAIELRAGVFPMDEVAEPAADASLATI